MAWRLIASHSGMSGWNFIGKVVRWQTFQLNLSKKISRIPILSWRSTLPLVWMAFSQTSPSLPEGFSTTREFFVESLQTLAILLFWHKTFRLHPVMFGFYSAPPSNGTLSIYLIMLVFVLRIPLTLSICCLQESPLMPQHNQAIL